MTKIYLDQPKDFTPVTTAAGCYIYINGKLLVLRKRLGQSDQGGLWGVPGGKLEKNEIPKHAAKRELFEETGIDVEHSQVKLIRTVYIRRADEIDYIFHMCQIQVEEFPAVVLSEEHQDARWVKQSDLDELPLMGGVKEAFEIYCKALDPQALWI